MNTTPTSAATPGPSSTSTRAPGTSPATPATAPVAGASAVPVRMTGVEYQHTLRSTPTGRGWRGLVALIATVTIYLLLSAVLGMASMIIDRFLGNQDMSAVSLADMRLTPAVLLATNLTAGLMIPIVAGLERALYGRSGTLHSVTGRFRRRWALRFALLITPLFVGYAAVSAFAFPTPSGPGRAPDWIALLIIVLLTTPLQAAGEEYMARGFLTRAVGAWFASPRIGLIVAMIVTSTLFTLAHGAADPWLISYYFVFGGTLAVVVWRTGGLEAPVVIHAINNVVMFGVGILFTDTTGSFDRSVGAGGPVMLIAMAVIMAVGALAILLGRRFGVARTRSAR